jgi:hypothetical protein
MFNPSIETYNFYISTLKEGMPRDFNLPVVLTLQVIGLGKDGLNLTWVFVMVVCCMSMILTFISHLGATLQGLVAYYVFLHFGTTFESDNCRANTIGNQVNKDLENCNEVSTCHKKMLSFSFARLIRLRLKCFISLCA